MPYRLKGRSVPMASACIYSLLPAWDVGMMYGTGEVDAGVLPLGAHSNARATVESGDFGGHLFSPIGVRTLDGSGSWNCSRNRP